MDSFIVDIMPLSDQYAIYESEYVKEKGKFKHTDSLQIFAVYFLFEHINLAANAITIRGQIWGLPTIYGKVNHFHGKCINFVT